jgi:hypothetical protein
MGYAVTLGNTTVPLVFTLVSSADHVTPLLGATPAVNLSKNGQPFDLAQGAITEVGLGAYQVAPDADDADTVGSLLLHAAAFGADITLESFSVEAVPVTPTPLPPSQAIEINAATIIRRALATLGKVGAGEPVQADLLTDAFATLQEMVDNWKTQRLLIPQLTRVEYQLLPGVTAITIGPGGMIDMETPHDVRFAFMVDTLNPTLERSIPVYNDEAFAQRPYKTLTGLESVTEVYYERTHPRGTLRVPASAAGGTLVLYVLIGLPGFADLTTDYLLMPGYAKALRYNLALQLAPEYGLQPNGFVFQEAATAIGDIKRLNIRHRILANYFGGAGGGYNIYSDEAR